MTLKALCRLLTASLVFSAVVITSIIASAQIPTRTANWVNIKDPKFGAIGDGSHDDTAAIQAAIDYAFAHGNLPVYCPAGKYLTSDSLWFDPPPGIGYGNTLRTTTFTGTGYISGTTLTISSGSTSGLRALYSHIYGAGVAADTLIISGTGPTYTVHNAQTVGSSGSPIALTGNNTNQSVGGNGFSFSFFGDPSNDQAYPSCQIFANFNNGHAIEVGTGAGMLVANLIVYGTGVAGQKYQGAQPSNGIGIAINGGNAGATNTLIRDIDISNFYSGIVTDANRANTLSDGNTFERARVANAYIGYRFQDQNTFINHVIDSITIDVNIGISTDGQPVYVQGGSFQDESAKSTSFALGSTTGLVNSSGNFTFTSTLSANNCGAIGPTCFPTSPDGFTYVGISTVYAWWGLNTTDFGVIPMTMTAWNSSTKQATFQLYEPWVIAEFGGTDISQSAALVNLSAELVAASVIYGTERTYVAQGRGIQLNHVTTENESVCATVMDVVVTGIPETEVPSAVRDLVNLSNPYWYASTSIPTKYCQRTMPVIRKQTSGYGDLILEGGDWSPPIGTYPYAQRQNAQRQTVEIASEPSGIVGRNLANLALIFRDGTVSASWAQDQTPAQRWETEGRGVGAWDRDYSLPSYSLAGGHGGVARDAVNNGDRWAPYCGVEPCQPSMPTMNAQLLGQICPGTVGGGGTVGSAITCSGSLGTFDTYVPIACRTMFKRLDWNTAASASPLFVRTASCPGYTWGQSINDTTLQAYETSSGISPLTHVAWHHIGQSPVLYLDDVTMGLMFPGLGIILDSGDGSGPLPFVVTGVYENENDLGSARDMGYVTVIGASSNSGSLLPGTETTQYTCTTGCTIGQVPFAWSVY